MQKEIGIFYVEKRKRKDGRYNFLVFYNSDKDKVIGKSYEEIKELLVGQFSKFEMVVSFCKAYATIKETKRSDLTWFNHRQMFNIDDFFNESEQIKLKKLINKHIIFTRDLQLIIFSTVLLIYNTLVKVALENEETYCTIFDELNIKDVNKIKENIIKKDIFLIRGYKLLIKTPLINKMNDTYKLCYHQYRNKNKLVQYIRLGQIEYDRLKEVECILNKEGIAIGLVKHFCKENRGIANLLDEIGEDK